MNKKIFVSNKLLEGIFLLLLLHSTVNCTSQPRTYPKQLHERVIEKLSQQRRVDETGKVGTWGPWSRWSPCSRSCDSGVMTQSRECRLTHRRKRSRQLESDGTNRCVGRYKRFQLCNTQVCPEGPIDFRREQCAAFDRTPFNRRFYTWEPFIDTLDSCALNCRAVGLNFYATLNQSVIDGTPCGVHQPHIRPQTHICVAGRCMKIGCDGLLGSGRELDTCGICGGNNSTCRLITGVYARASLPFGYNLIATLPPKAENVSFYHVKTSSNYLALREVGGSYLLNGPEGVNSSGSFAASGTIFTYARPHAFGGDHLFARGPTTHSLDVMLFYQVPDPGITYEYRLSTGTGPSKPQARLHLPDDNLRLTGGSPFRNSQPPGIVNDAISSNSFAQNRISPNYKDSEKEKKQKFKKEREKKYKLKLKDKTTQEKKRRKKYAWIVSGFTPCSQTCGGGIQITRTICVKRNRKEVEAPAHFCIGLSQPPEEVVRCNLRPCPAQWEGGQWSACTVTCGIGIQTRSMTCRQRISTDLTIDASEDACSSVTKIPTAQVCQMRECNGPPKWETYPWSSCSSECSLGTRKRDVTCTNSIGKVDENLCEQPKPSEQEMCDMGSCAADTWFFSSWDTSCQGPCGEGVQRRRVHCSGDALQSKESPTSCPLDSKPESARRCESKEACSGSWFTGPWNECDSRCGTGRQRRAVVCVMWNRGQYRVAKDASLCKAAGERPSDTRSCAVECKAEWFTSGWSECSSSCGNGVQRREIKCLEHQRPSLACSSATKPDSRQNCNVQSCLPEHLNDSAAHLEEPLDSLMAFEDSDTYSDKKFKELKKKSQTVNSKGVCMDRMKNCHLVYKARLCRLKYYNKLCCKTCSKI